MLQLVVAEKLGYTLAELQERATVEEMLLWSAFYEYRSDQERSAMEEQLHELKLANQKMRKKIAKLSVDKDGNIFSTLNAKNFIVDNLNKRNQELVSQCRC